jgi:hypothetical protein
MEKGGGKEREWGGGGGRGNPALTVKYKNTRGSRGKEPKPLDERHRASIDSTVITKSSRWSLSLGGNDR